MSFTNTEKNLGTRHIGGDLANMSHVNQKEPSEGGRTASETHRTDTYSGTTPTALSASDVAADVEGTIITITPQADPSGGNTFTFAILSGNGDSHFELDQAGKLTRETSATLVGPYELLITATSGSPLFRAQTFEASISVAA